LAGWSGSESLGAVGKGIQNIRFRFPRVLPLSQFSANNEPEYLGDYLLPAWDRQADAFTFYAESSTQGARFSSPARLATLERVSAEELTGEKKGTRCLARQNLFISEIEIERALHRWLTNMI
jgi:hypothetical protein